MLIDLLKDIVAFIRRCWKESGEWQPSVLDELGPSETRRKPGRPKGSKNKKK
jgi:hypothetical protein